MELVCSSHTDIIPEFTIETHIIDLHLDLILTTTETNTRKQVQHARISTGINYADIDKVTDEISRIIDFEIFDKLINDLPGITNRLDTIKKWRLVSIVSETEIKLCMTDKKTMAFVNMIKKFKILQLIRIELLITSRKKRPIVIVKLKNAIGIYNAFVNNLRKNGPFYWKIPVIDTKPKKFRGQVENKLRAGIDDIEDNAIDKEIKLTYYFLTGTNDMDDKTRPIIIDIITRTKYISKCINLESKIKSKIIRTYMNVLYSEFNKKDLISPIIASPTISICTHKTTSVSHSCWTSTVENLISFLDMHISNPEKWLCKSMDIKSMPVRLSTDGSLVKILEIECPMKKTNHCNKQLRANDQCCSKGIPLKKILNFIPLQQRKIYQKLVPKLYMDICKLHYPQLFFYCVNPICTYANTGFLYNEFAHNFDKKLDTHTNCKKCNATHYVHQHRIICPGCQTTFCNVCQQTPYHEKELCLGPNIDPDTLAIIKETGAKLCPNCSEAVIRIDGCDHIKCKCKIDWCYRCGQVLNSNNVYKHTCVSADFLNGNVSFAYHS